MFAPGYNRRFQSTLPRGERQYQDPVLQFFRNFNPRSREGSDPVGKLVHPTLNTFQSTLPRGERPDPARSLGLWRRFQSTLPRGERRSHDAAVSSDFFYFNPRSREGSDDDKGTQSGDGKISIHAPARGATIKPISSISSLSISIHAPARGATISRPGILRSQHISIHAPARGATKIPGHKDGCPVFQSTLPRGERQDKNPVDTLKILISIHAPARGATSRQGPHRRLICISIHAPARGATLLPEHSSAVSGTFQSTLPRGERHKSRLRY